MSSITINSNLASLGTQRRLGNTTAELGRSYERLSSGLRINRASDDAAGLAIASSLNADNRVFNQGIRNLNDGLSLLNVADGALTELSNIVVRIRELAEQSANGTLSNQQREAIDQEAQELSDEFTRIAQTTEVNGLKLFDGSLGELSLQAGYGERGAVTSTLGGAIGDGSFSQANSFAVGNSPQSVTTADLNGDGVFDLVTADRSDATVSVLLGAGDGSFSQASSFAVGNGPRSVTTADFNGDGVLDLVTADNFDQTVSVLLGAGDGNFSQASSFAVGNGPFSVTTADLNGDGVLDLVTADYGDDAVSVLLGAGDGSFSQASSFAVGNLPWSVTTADLNGDGVLDLVTAGQVVDTVSVLLGAGDGSFSQASSFAVGDSPVSVTTADFNGDGVLDLVTANRNDDSVSVLLGAGDGSFSQASSFAVGDRPFSVTTADFNGDRVLDLVTADFNDDSVSVLLGAGDGSFGQASSFAVGNRPFSVTTADFNGDGVLDLVTADDSDDTVSVLLGETISGVSPLLPFSLSTKADALQAMAPLDRKIEQLALQKGTIGAFQSRVETAINNLQVSSTNVKAAESRIADVDTAFEAAQLARLNILQQAGAAVLAQANVQPQLALRLLET